MYAEALMAWWVHSGFQATVLACLVLGIVLAFGHRLEARWRFGLWLVVLVRLALPATPGAPWSIFGLSTSPKTTPIARVQPMPTGHDLDLVFTDPPVTPTVEAASNSSAESPTPPPHNAPPITLTPGQWWVVIWAVGVAVLTSRYVLLCRRLRRQRREWREVTDPTAQSVLSRCRKELGIVRPVPLLESLRPVGPATCGAWNPCIVVPTGLIEQLSPDELRMILLHELSHVRRRDVLVGLIAAGIVAFHWFNPVAWLALAGVRRERELACDEAVLRQVGPGFVQQYGRTVLNVASQWLAQKRLPVTVGIFGTNRSLTRRITMIARYRKTTWVRSAVGLLLLLSLGVVGLTDAEAQVPQKATPPVQAKAEAKGTQTIRGICEDEYGKPISGVRVALYRHKYGEMAEHVKDQGTGENGHYEFSDLPPLSTSMFSDEWGYALVITKSSRASFIAVKNMKPSYTDGELRTVTLLPATTFEGHVTDTNGRPVVGAHVYFDSHMEIPPDGVWSSKTDANGYFAIKDAREWAGNGYFVVSHPDFARSRPRYKQMPGAVSVVLQPAAIIEGLVVDQVTGKPASGVRVLIQGVNKSKPANEYSHDALTDVAGKYRIPSVNAGEYNVLVDHPDRVATALDSLAVKAGEVNKAPDLVLTEGSWIVGQLTDADTKKPISGALPDGRRHSIGLYGPSHPRSGAACSFAEVDDQGRFRMRVAPGINYPYLMTMDFWPRTEQREFFEKGIEVRSGEAVNVQFRIMPAPPRKVREPNSVQLPLPVADELAAALKIRECGGWYKLDAEKHVVEVNMVFHEPAGRRFDNDQTDTDAALRVVSAFPRLRSLLLKGGQATEAGLATLTGLKNLEDLTVWNAVGVTDAGVAHLVSLKSLKSIHFSSGAIGDGALAAFGKMPQLERLSLQGNAFTDDGLKHLGGLKQLQSLWIGLNKGKITENGIRHLGGLNSLNQLDLQWAQNSDAAVEPLKELKELRLLILGGDATERRLTDQSIGVFQRMPHLTRLHIGRAHLTEQGLRRLLSLPGITELYISIPNVPETLEEQLKKEFPKCRLHITRLGAD